jgi:S1-C subfamily serine protease
MTETIQPDTASANPTSTPANRPWYRRRTPWACAAAVVAGTLAVAAPLATASLASGAEVATSAAATWTPAQPPFARGFSGGGSGSGSSSGSSGALTYTAQAAATAADTAESTGVVIIETVLGYDDASAAGTGLVLSSDGLILTNNHVIEGSTEISVTIATTGETYAATVVGSDSADDVAVLQLTGASGLETVTLDDDGDPAVGDAITAVGNADGGGVLLAADGSVTALGSTVTTSSAGTGSSESLDGMIEIAADVVSGDSGGAVLDDEGEVVGVTTAASVGSATTVAYAIPIDDALAIVDEILAGDESGGATIGYPAFLGVQVASGVSSAGGPATRPGAASSAAVAGAPIAGVIDGTPAAAAGLTAGDTVTAVDGTAVTDSTALSTVLSAYAPGDTVSISWTDAAGTAHTAAVTLIAGPAA